MTSRLAPTGRSIPDVLRVAADAVENLPQARVTGQDVRTLIRAAGNYAEAEAAYAKALQVLGEPGAWMASRSQVRSRLEAVALLRTAVDAVERGDTSDLPSRQAKSIAFGVELMEKVAARHDIEVTV